MVRERIKEHYDSLSPSFQRVADFLLDHAYEAAFMTATQLGRRLEVDTATVVRFAQRLEYPGFPELLDEVQEEVQAQLVAFFQPAARGDEPVDMFTASLRQSIANLQQVDLLLPRATVDRVVELLDRARRIWVTGENRSRSLADLLTGTLRLLGYNAVTLSTDASAVAAELREGGPADLLIGVAATHYCPDVTGTLELGRERGVRTIALTGADSWPVARAVDITIVCPNTSPMPLQSVTALAAVIDALSQTLLEHRRIEVAPGVHRFEEMLRHLTALRGAVEIAPLLPTNGDAGG